MPSDKRARQRAGREARMAELRRAQQAKRNRLRGGVIGVIIVIVIVLALVTSGAFSSGSSKNKKVTSKTVSGGTASLTSAAQAALKPVSPPATSTTCTGPIPSPSSPATTVPAKGNAVATIEAPSATMPFPNLDGSSPHYTKFSGPAPWCLDLNKQYTAIVKTDIGTVTIELLPQYAPLAVNNFVFLAGYHYFDGTVFHRVIPGFVDQGGDPTGTGQGGPGYTFPDELPSANAAYDTGAVAMANSGANTNGSQFFWVVAGGGAQLQPSYSMYGQITDGMNVVNKINSEGTTGGTPSVLHRIVSVTIQVSAPPTTTTTTAGSTTTTAAPTTTSPPATTSESTTTSTTSRSSSTSTTR